MDRGGDFFHVCFEQATRGDGGSAEADAGGLKRGARLVGNGIFVERDVREIEGLLGFFGGEIREVAAKIDEEEVIVGAAGQDFIAALGHGGGEGAGVFDDLLGVGLPLGFEALAEAHGFGRDHMHQRAALSPGEHGGVDGLGVGGAAEDEAAAGTAQGFVRGGRDEIGVRHGRGMDAGGDETGDVRDVGKKVGPHAAGDLAHSGEVDDARVGAGADGDHLGLLAEGDGGEFLVVDQTGILADAVLAEVVEFAGEVGGIAVGEVAAVAEVHAEQFVAGLEDGGVDGGVGLSAGVGLDVGVVGAEEQLGAINGELLDLVDEFAATIPSFAGVAFGVFVGEHAALRLHDGGVGEIFRSDELDVALLPGKLGGEGRVDGGIELGEGSGVQHCRVRLADCGFEKMVSKAVS